jgi:septum formation protein
MRLILASSSPRRRDLLRRAGFTFDVVPPQVVERHEPGESAEAYVLRNARAKAEWAAGHPGRGTLPIVGADTVVVQDGVILEKPADPDDARAMLRRLSGRSHQVWTGVCLIRDDVRAFAEKTTVSFHRLSDTQIDAYVATGEPLDKAGAYAIQGGAGAMIRRIDGSYSNVVGLPMERLQAELGQGPGGRRKSPV